MKAISIVAFYLPTFFLCWSISSLAILGLVKRGSTSLLAPGFDFPKGTMPSNTYSQMLRAVESGFSLGRSANNGLSVAVDYHGRILSSMSYFTTAHEAMYADVPTTGT